MGLVICGLNQKASPLPLIVRSAELASINVCMLEIFGLPLFFLRGPFLWAPLHFLGLPLFSSEVFVISPFAVLGFPLFFIRGLCDKSLCTFGVPSFFIGGLCLNPLCIFGDASFFIGGLCDEPMNEGS
jgi:hypothetical protein